MSDSWFSLSQADQFAATSGQLQLIPSLVALKNDSASPQISTPANKAPINVSEGTVRDRGQLLYENHCTVCHDSSVSIREHRKVRSLADIRYWVYRWSRHLNLEWTEAEVNDIVDFLNQRFYHFSREGAVLPDY